MTGTPLGIDAVKSSYKRWAPIYDGIFGTITKLGRKQAVEHINKSSGSVLEVGVGTGLSLRHYKSHLKITGIDVSTHMLAKARRKVTKLGLQNIDGILEMDATDMDFPDNHFDTVVAMFLVSVVPEPEKAIAEMARVCKPGGQVLIMNHFAVEKGAMAKLERLLAPFASKIGWHSDFEMQRVTGEEQLKLQSHTKHPPLGMFSFLKMQKKPQDTHIN